MQDKFHHHFDTMDSLSQQGVPYFFIIDFLMENVEVFTEKELSERGILVDFKGFKNVQPKEISQDLEWETYPEDKETYEKGFQIVQENLKKGNSYLINYTRKTKVETNRTLEEIFYLSKAKYKVFYPEKFVFFSPETFVLVEDNTITTHPMKGTIDADIPNAEQILKSNEKEKAEHYTVVDLLRNDLSMVADEVKVDAFQRVDFIKTRQKNLLAMSSEISGKVKPEFRGKIGSLMKTLLPAGSILGAPKPKTLEIILSAETDPRGYYTGVCGWFDGKDLDSCVMIRMIQQEGEELYFRSGGGITHKSQLEEEYEEMKNKIYVPK